MTADQLLERVRAAYEQTSDPDVHPPWERLPDYRREEILQFSRALIVPLLKDVLEKLDLAIDEMSGEANGG